MSGCVERLALQQCMDMKANQVLSIARHAFGKRVYSGEAYVCTLLYLYV
jgi:hypothetical protein